MMNELTLSKPGIKNGQFFISSTVKIIAVLKCVQSLYTCHVQAVINNEQNKVNKFDHRLYTCHVQAVINNEQNEVNKFDHRLYTSWKFLYMLSGTGLEVIKLHEQNIKAY